MTALRLRPAQEEILRYRGGYMGVAAVPGAGKTFTLSLLAARLITDGLLRPDQEVLIVTLTNSAVDTFSARIRQRLQERGLLTGLGYRIRTLHGLAHDIVREKPALAGLDERFGILDEREALYIRRQAVHAWLQAHPDAFAAWLKDDLSPQQNREVARKHLPALLEETAHAFIRTAKDRRLSPQLLRARLQEAPEPLELADFCLDIYTDYQRALTYRGAVDFDDLIRLSLDVLEQDADYLARLQERWPFILEDEAQDSSRLQEDLLRLLSSRYGNWVRVGDPNQAIYETFTTANPRYLRQFLAREDVLNRPLPQSGRSQPWIIALANYLVHWTMHEHPAAAVRDALHAPPEIQPTGQDDPQPNPPADPQVIFLSGTVYTPEKEIQLIIRSLKKWLPANPQATVAILVPSNDRGAKFAQALKEAGLPHLELLRTTDHTRRTARLLADLLHSLAEPHNPRLLAAAYRVLRRDWREDRQRAPLLRAVSRLLEGCPALETYLAPLPGQDWLAQLPPETPDEVRQELQAFRPVVLRWQEATLLPIDQLTLTLAQEIFTQPLDLALAHKLALLLAQVQRGHPDYRLPDLAHELTLIAENKRGFPGFSNDDTGFNPDDHPGQVVVATMHKAKGLEWDRVYLTSVSNYDFPSLEEGENYRAENWFIREQYNLQAEALAQLDRLLHPNQVWQPWQADAASRQAREELVRERLRLLYVGLTRARRDLSLTANDGRFHTNTLALPLRALIAWWQENGGRA